MLQSYVPAGHDEIPRITLEYWQCYEDLEDCLEPVKTLSILLEPSTEAMIYDTLDYFLRLLYEVLEPVKTLSILLEPSTEAMIYDLDYFLRLLYEVFETAPKRRHGACTVFNTFVDVFRRKLLKLLDAVEQFFLWFVAAALDGRKTNFDWLAPVWDHGDEWPNVTKEHRNVYQL